MDLSPEGGSASITIADNEAGGNVSLLTGLPWRLVDPDPAEPVAVRIGHDRSTGPIAKDAGVFPELAGITAFHDPEGRQERQERPCENGRGQPDPEPAKPPPGLSAGLSGGLAEVSCGLDAFELRLADSLLGAFRGRIDGVLAQVEGGRSQALLDPLLKGRADLGHAVEALGHHGIELFRFLAIQAGPLEAFDIVADQSDLINQSLEGILDAHGSPAPAPCALASSSASSPTSSF